MKYIIDITKIITEKFMEENYRLMLEIIKELDASQISLGRELDAKISLLYERLNGELDAMASTEF